MEASRLPPGQILTRGFPVVGERESPTLPSLAQWDLVVDSGVDRRAFSWRDIKTLQSETLESDIHCVTSWTRLNARFTGIRLKDFLELHGIVWPGNRRFIRFLAYSERAHDTSLPIALALDDAWLIHTMDGMPLPHQHGGPLRVVTPSRYFYKSLKWLRRMEFLDEDRLGFWERTSDYHNDGRPWEEERFGSGRRWTPEECQAFRDLEDFSDQQDRIALQVSFRQWRPKSKDLRRVQLKACRFNDADLRGVDFSHANLTLSHFAGANLENAVFEGTDLEGADFSSANLRGARFENCHLSATKFHRGLETHPERLTGAVLRGGHGLLESERAFLERLGVSQP